MIIPKESGRRWDMMGKRGVGGEGVEGWFGGGGGVHGLGLSEERGEGEKSKD